MIFCLRSSRFSFPDRSATIFLELRRKHNLKGGLNAKQFVVTRRTNFGVKIISNKTYATLSEARKGWIAQAKTLEDQGLKREDFGIVGFHEED